MRMNKFYFLLFVLLNYTLSVCAQMKSPLTLPSPNVASLGYFGKTPVSFFTGTPQISVPLYTIKCGELSLPITLNYQATGVMPDNHPGWVGLNWNLASDGIIYRSVNDMPDEQLYAFRWEDSQTKRLDNVGYFYNRNVLNVAEWETFDYVKSLASDRFKFWKDTEPDEFTFNFFGIAGSFYLGHDGNWNVKSVTDNIKVEFDNQFIDLPDTKMVIENHPTNRRCFSGFKIITEDGTQYIFGKSLENIEYSIQYPQATYEEYIGNAWHLKEIINTDGQKVSFQYEKDALVSTAYKYSFNHYLEIGDPGTGSCKFDFYKYISTVSGATYMLLSPSYLKRITTPGEVIEFARSTSTELRNQPALINPTANLDPFYETYRSLIFMVDPTITGSVLGSVLNDKMQWKKLDAMRIQTVSTESSKPLYEYQFSYNNTATERLMLQSIQKVANNGNGDSYKFQYYDHPDVQLPPYRSPQIDHWGYYNGKTTNTDVEHFAVGENYSLTFYQDYWQQREPTSDLNLLQEGSLKKIIYPTGGASEFVYEQHDYAKEVTANRSVLQENTSNKKTGGIRVKKILEFTDELTEPTNVRDFYYTRNYGSGDNLSSGVLTGQSQYWFFHSGAPWPNAYIKKQDFSTNSILPFAGNSSGMPVAYSEVTEKRSDGAYAVYRYTNHDNGHLDGQMFRGSDILNYPWSPYYPYNDKSLERGLLLSSRSYNKTGQLIALDTVKYQALDQKYVRSINTNSLACGSFGVANCYAYKNYIYKFKAVESSSTVYDENGQYPRTELVKYYFDNANYSSATRQEKLNSKGQNVIIKKKYPFDFSGVAVYDAMVNKNMVNKVIEELHLKDDSTYLKQKVIYDFWNTPQLIKPSLLQKSVGNSIYETEMTFTKYDQYGNNTEATRRDGMVISGLWDHNGQHQTVQAVNAANTAVNYTSFETSNDGGWTVTGGSKVAGGVSGSYQLSLFANSSHSLSTDSLSTGKEYIISFWFTGAEPVLSGDVGLVQKNKRISTTAGGWNYYQVEISATQLVVIKAPANQSSYVDEVRRYPKDAAMWSYAYKPGVGMTSLCDEKGGVLTYEYDPFGRLDLTRDQENNILKKYCYNYAGQPENCVITYLSAAKSGSFKPNNCPVGSTGDWISYTVATGKYTSTISQADADQKAQNAVTANGQAYANANGICKMPIYATLEVDFIPTSIFNGNCVEQYNDVLIYFYKDAAKTIPYNVNNLTIQIKRGRTGYSNGSAGPTTYTITSYACTGTSFTLPGQLTLEGCASGCPGGMNCLPKQNDPHVKYSYELVDDIFYLTVSPTP